MNKVSMQSGHRNGLMAMYKKVRKYFKDNNIHPKPYSIKMNQLLTEFIAHVGEEVPAGMSKKDFVLSLYKEEKYIFTRTDGVRSDIPNSVWKELRKRVIRKYGRRCLCCNSDKDISIDHVKPYLFYPELRTEFSNLQPLCRSCNSRKGTKVIDYRKN